MIYENEKYKLSLNPDYGYESPREMENITILVTKKLRDYEVGDIITLDHPLDEVANILDIELTHFIYSEEDEEDVEVEKSVEDIMNEIREKALIYPLYITIHSNIVIHLEEKTTGYNQWDTAFLGFALIKFDTIISNFGELTHRTKRESLGQLKRELSMYNDYLNGEIYSFTLEEKEVCDNCSTIHYKEIQCEHDFYGTNVFENGIYEVLNLDSDSLKNLLMDENLIY